MPACELRPATQYDTDAVYALICELKQAEFDHHAFRVGFNANLRPQTCATIWRCWMAKLSA